MKKYIYFGMLLCHYTTLISTQAWVKVPICDMISKPWKETDQRCSRKDYYNNLPWSGQRSKGCDRIHQLLFNEMVTIIEEKGDECLVKIHNIFYEPENLSERYNFTFWVLKNNLITSQLLSSLGISQNAFPQQINFESQCIPKKNNQTIVTLRLPFFDTKTKVYYSVGTRFVCTSQQNKRTEYSVYVFDTQHNRLITTIIPANICHVTSCKDQLRKKIECFVALLRLWTQQQGFIPYVWGGTSFTHLCTHEAFELKEVGDQAFYIRPHYNAKGPKAGLDCSGLILRAAQICGIPYYFKNSTMIKKKLNPVITIDTLHEGDIIWVKGHVMVVASIKNNTLIEARGYDDGYGKVHEIALEEVFCGVKDYKQLLELYKNKKPLERLNDKGQVSDLFSTFAVLSLESICR